MKANELMIGDWVCQKESGLTLKVSRINPPYIEAEGEEGQFHEDTLRPLRATGDILTANGFEFTEADKLFNVRRSMCHLSRMNGEYKYVNKTRKGYLIDCTIVGYSDLHKQWQIVQMFGKDMSIDAGNVNSFHELQHAIRLCGINKEIIL